MPLKHGKGRPGRDRPVTTDFQDRKITADAAVLTLGKAAERFGIAGSMEDRIDGFISRSHIRQDPLQLF